MDGETGERAATRSAAMYSNLCGNPKPLDFDGFLSDGDAASCCYCQTNSAERKRTGEEMSSFGFCLSVEHSCRRALAQLSLKHFSDVSGSSNLLPFIRIRCLMSVISSWQHLKAQDYTTHQPRCLKPLTNHSHLGFVITTIHCCVQLMLKRCSKDFRISAGNDSWSCPGNRLDFYVTLY